MRIRVNEATNWMRGGASGRPGEISVKSILPILAAMSLASGLAFAASSKVMNWTIDGTRRQAIVYAPGDNAGKAPVIFAFHGHGGNMQDADAGMRLQNYWPEAIVVYMQGLPTNPASDPQGFGWIYQPKQDGGDRDLKFVDAVIATLRAELPVDERRIYATGFSNGAMFTYVLWGTRARTFAAFAAVAGRIVPAVQLTDPKPLLHIAGEQDTTVPFQEQLHAIKTAREVNGDLEDGVTCGNRCTVYSSSKAAPVMTYIHAGGHVYPPGASEMIVKFFQSHKLAQ